MKDFRKKLALGLMLLTPFVLAGCFNLGGGTTTTPKVTTDERFRTLDDPAFKIVIPREWDVIEKKDFTSEVPQETLLVLRNNVKNEDFTANANVVRRDLQTTKETLEYAKEVINREKTGLYNYKELQRNTVKILIGDKSVDTYSISFEGAKDPASPVLRFFQTYAVKDKFAYIVTGAVSTKENDNNIKTVQDIVKSFSLK